MGCGAQRMALMDLYINEATPPLHYLRDLPSKLPVSFPANGLINKDGETYFDDKELIKQCQAVHIDVLKVHYEEVITGIEVKYRLDQSGQVRRHYRKPGSRQESLELENKESIVRIEAQVSDSGVHALELETSAGRILRVKGSDPGEETIKLDFRTDSRGIVGFKGCFGECLKALGCYTWKIRTR